jgi:isopropylmalate/homocitrate/citramalate synthase
MKTKLTLTIDKKVIERAKLRSKRENKSISQLVEDFLKDEGKENDTNYKLKAFEKQVKKVMSQKPQKNLSRAEIKKIWHNHLMEKYA